MCFSGFVVVILSLTVLNKPTVIIIDRSFLCQWANVQNQQGIKKITLYLVSEFEFLGDLSL